MGDAKKDPEAMLAKGQEMLGAGQEELALQFFQRGIELRPTSAELHKALGETLMEMGRVDDARVAFLKCAECDPSDGGIWMYLGQIAQGKDALGHYEKGVAALQRQGEEAAAQGRDAEASELSRQICAAYCSLAELFMSDLCFEADAEARCEQYLVAAQAACPDNPQALQGMASFRISQQRPEDAKPLILRALGVIEDLMSRRGGSAPSGRFARDGEEDEEEGEDSDEEMENDGANGEPAAGYQSGAGSAAAAPAAAPANKNGVEASRGTAAADEDMGGSGSDEDDNLEAEDLLPPFEFRAATARILIELHEFARAVPFLERLVDENDEIAEVWLLLGQCHVALNRDDFALECFEMSADLCDRLVAFEPELAADEQFSTLMKNVAALKAEAEARLEASETAGAAGSKAPTPAPAAP